MKRVIISLLLLATAAQAGTKTFRVGQIFRFQDKFNATVEEMLAGMELARQFYEKDHPNVHIKFSRIGHAADDKLVRNQETNLASVAEAAREFLATDIPVAIGGEMSDESIVLGDLFKDQHRVLLTPTSTNPAVTLGKPFTFRACFSDELVADRMAEYAVTRLKPQAIGVLHNVSSPYTDFLSRRFTERFQELAAKIPGYHPRVVVQKYLRRHMDFSPQVKAFQDAGITHVAAFNHDMEMLNYLAFSTKADFNPLYLTSDGWGSNNYIFDQFIKQNPKGDKFVVIRNSYWNEASQAPLAVRFRKARLKQTKDLSPSAAMGFDTAWMLFHAMDNAKDAGNADSIREALMALKGLSLVTSRTLSFPKDDNTPVKELHLYRIDKLGVHFEETLK